MNLSMTEGVFPSEMKIAKVLPLDKGDNPMIVNDYSHVSLYNRALLRTPGYQTPKLSSKIYTITFML